MLKMYGVGLAGVLNGSTKVIGKGTFWLSSVVPGNQITFDGETQYTIASVDTNEELTLTTPYVGKDLFGQMSVIDVTDATGNLATDVNGNQIIFERYLGSGAEYVIDDQVLQTLDQTNTSLEIRLDRDTSYQNDFKGLLESIALSPIGTSTPPTPIPSPLLGHDGDGIGTFTDLTVTIPPINQNFLGNINGVPASQITGSLQSAQAAKDFIDSIFADNVINVAEKKEIKSLFETMKSEIAKLYKVAFSLSIEIETDTAYVAFRSLEDLLYVMLADMTTSTSLTKSTYRAAIEGYYAARDALVAQINLVSSTKASWNQISGANKPQDGATVGAPPGTVVGTMFAEEIEASVSNVVNSIADFSLDNRITPLEKSKTRDALASATAERSNLLTVSSDPKYDQNRGLYDAAFLAIQEYITVRLFATVIDLNHPTSQQQTLLHDMTATSIINGQELRDLLFNYKSKRSALTTQLNADAIARAQTALNETANTRLLGPPSNKPFDLTINDSQNGNATRRITIGWDYIQGEKKADMFYIYMREGNQNPTIVDANDTVDGNVRYKTYMADPSKEITAGIAAVRKTDNGYEIGEIVYSPSWHVTPIPVNYTGNLNGRPMSQVLQTLDIITDFNVSNSTTDNTPIPSCTITSDGTAIDHTMNTDGSVNISVEWGWTGDQSTIDGFALIARASLTGEQYAILSNPAQEMMFEVHPNKRSAIFYSMPADWYYTVGVVAYRKVLKSIASEGILYSPTIAQPTRPEENPYRPSATVSFNGNVSGTIDNEPVASIRAKTAKGETAFDQTAGFRNTNPPTNNVVFGNTVITTPNAAGLVDITINWTYAQGVLPADFFNIYVTAGSVNAPTKSSAMMAQISGSARSYTFFGTPNDTAFAAGIAPGRNTMSGQVLGAITTGWQKTAGTVNINSNVMVNGSISGTSNIDINGSARFNGAISTPQGNAAVRANDSGNQPIGVYSSGTIGGYFATTATSFGFGILATTPSNDTSSCSAVSGTTTNGNAINGIANGTGNGVKGSAGSANAIGVRADNTFGGTALSVQGKMVISSNALVSNLNAQYVNGFDSAHLVKSANNNFTLSWNADAGSSQVVIGKTHTAWVRLTIDASTYYMPLFT